MNFALVGLDENVRRLIERVVAQGEDRIVAFWAPAESAPQARAILPGAKQLTEWEAVLGESVDAVIVARDGGDDLRADQLRTLIQAAIPLVVSHPIHPSMLVCYELDMIRQETGCPILPLAPARFSTAYERLLETIRGKPQLVGALEQVIFERWLGERSPSHVREAFAQDMDLARPLTGDLTRLAALAPTSEPAGWASLGVQLSGPSNVLVRWSVAPPDTEPGGRMTVVGSTGRVILDMPGAHDWTLETRGESSSNVETFPRCDGEATALARLKRLLAGQAVEPTWTDACRAIELADSIQRSLEKGRTVELHYENYTEQGTFKGQMTSLGCGLLWGSLVVLIIGVVAAGFRLPLADYWPQLLLVVLSAFLLLQLLRFVFPSQAKDASDRQASHR